MLRFTESATEKIPLAEMRPGGRPEENLRDAEWNATQARVKRWGKSPPLRQ
jgi:hypothetical protein